MASVFGLPFLQVKSTLAGGAKKPPLSTVGTLADYEIQLQGKSLFLSSSKRRTSFPLLPQVRFLHQTVDASSERTHALNRKIHRGPASEISSVEWERVQATGDAWSIEAYASTQTYDLELEITPLNSTSHSHSPSSSPSPNAWEMNYSLRYLKDVLVDREVFVFELPLQEIKMLDRSYHLSKVTRKNGIRVGEWTPHWMLLGGRNEPHLTLSTTTGFMGVGAFKTSEGSRIELELDHPDYHPFEIYEACVEEMKNVPKKINLSHSLRKKGEIRTGRVLFHLEHQMLPLAARFPYGFESGIVFTDHADQTNAQRTEAFAYGRTGADHSSQKGFVGRGLSYSKTVFVDDVRGYPQQMGDPQMRKLLRELQNQGVEIGVHSVSGKRDEPYRVLASLQKFRKTYRGRTWIDHQPNTNCEAISNQGWDPMSSWYVLKNLEKSGYDYLWSVRDVSLPQGSVNLLSQENPSARRPVVYTQSRIQGEEKGFYLFNSSWFHVGLKRFLSFFRPEAMQRLQQEHGVSIGHVYFENYKKEAFVLKQEEGGYVLAPELDQLFAQFQVRQKEKKLWVVGIEAMGDYWKNAFHKVRIHSLGENRFRIENTQDHPILGYSLFYPDTRVSLSIEGEPVKGKRMDLSRNMIHFWFDLPANAVRTIEVHPLQSRKRRRYVSSN